MKKLILLLILLALAAIVFGCNRNQSGSANTVNAIIDRNAKCVIPAKSDMIVHLDKNLVKRSLRKAVATRFRSENLSFEIGQIDIELDSGKLRFNIDIDKARYDDTIILLKAFAEFSTRISGELSFENNGDEIISSLNFGHIETNVADCSFFVSKAKTENKIYDKITSIKTFRIPSMLGVGDLFNNIEFSLGNEGYQMFMPEDFGFDAIKINKIEINEDGIEVFISLKNSPDEKFSEEFR